MQLRSRYHSSLPLGYLFE